MAGFSVRRLVAVVAAAGPVLGGATASAVAVSGQPSTQTVTVTITLAGTTLAGSTPDQTQVNVYLTTGGVQYVLALQVNTEALPRGGFGVAPPSSGSLEP